MEKLIKLRRREIKQLNKLVLAMNNLLNIENPISVKTTLKNLNMSRKYNENLKFDYGENKIRVYSTLEDWKVHKSYEKIYFELSFNECHEFYFYSNCKTPYDYIPKIVKTRIEKGFKYLARNSSDFIRKINLVIDADRRDLALEEFIL